MKRLILIFIIFSFFTKLFAQENDNSSYKKQTVVTPKSKSDLAAEKAAQMIQIREKKPITTNNKKNCSVCPSSEKSNTPESLVNNTFTSTETNVKKANIITKANLKEEEFRPRVLTIQRISAEEVKTTVEKEIPNNAPNKNIKLEKKKE